MFFFIVFALEAFSQNKDFKNQVGLTYKGILPVDNPNDRIVRFNHNMGLGYRRLLRENHSLGLNLFYSRSKYLVNLLGFETYYQYQFPALSEKVKPFVKANAGFQTSVKERYLTFTYTRQQGDVWSKWELNFPMNPKVFYFNPEVGIALGIGKRYILEPAIGYVISTRNFKNKYLDAHLQNKNLMEGMYDPFGNPLPTVRPEEIKSTYFEPKNLSFGLMLGMCF